MNLPHFLDYISDGTLVITPGDRTDVILGSLAATVSETYPNISGLLLTGRYSSQNKRTRAQPGEHQDYRSHAVGTARRIRDDLLRDVQVQGHL